MKGSNPQQESCFLLNQMHRRKTMSKMTLQGNFYPMTSAAYIQDDLSRLTLLSGQSHGVASLNKVMYMYYISKCKYCTIFTGFAASGKVREKFIFLESQGICSTFWDLGKIMELFLSLLNGQGKSGNFVLTHVKKCITFYIVYQNMCIPNQIFLRFSSPRSLS